MLQFFMRSYRNNYINVRVCETRASATHSMYAGTAAAGAPPARRGLIEVK